MYSLYRTFTYLVSPLIPVLLKRRLARGKEDGARMQERLGFASLPRPAGKLLWIHAASVGEANSVLPLISALLNARPQLHILLTTVTVTSAAMMRTRLPERSFHQFAIVDSPAAVHRFLDHWRPDIALWVDSEFWPNIIMETKKRGILTGIINARMSEKSFRSWQMAKGLIERLLSCFTICFAQSEEDSARLIRLGIPLITSIGNLKYDAPELPFDSAELARMQTQIASRPVWVAASTHPGEEKMIAEVHKALKPAFPHLLTIIVPRHAQRGDVIKAELAGMDVAQRSKNHPLKENTDIYLADTMGELGLFYKAAPIVFIGGTLVKHGGQNPLEAARMGCAVLTGPHFHNFASIVRGLEKDKAIVSVGSEEALTAGLQHLLQDQAARERLSDAAKKHAASKGGVISKIMNELQPYLS